MALHVLRQRPDLEVVGLLTTFNEEFDRVAMHAVRRELVEAQAATAGLPLFPVMLPFPCTNSDQGVQYAATAYVEALTSVGTSISMAAGGERVRRAADADDQRRGGGPDGVRGLR